MKNYEKPLLNLILINNDIIATSDKSTDNDIDWQWGIDEGQI